MENNTLKHKPKEKRKSAAIRVSLMEKEPSGPVLGLCLDKKKPQDESFHIQGVTFIVDKSLLEQCGSINIDFIEAGNNSGFKITATNPLFSENDNQTSVPYGSLGLCH